MNVKNGDFGLMSNRLEFLVCSINGLILNCGNVLITKGWNR